MFLWGYMNTKKGVNEYSKSIKKSFFLNMLCLSKVLLYENKFNFGSKNYAIFIISKHWREVEKALGLRVRQGSWWPNQYTHFFSPKLFIGEVRFNSWKLQIFTRIFVIDKHKKCILKLFFLQYWCTNGFEWYYYRAY